jgi:hypothetical protein
VTEGSFVRISWIYRKRTTELIGDFKKKLLVKLGFQSQWGVVGTLCPIAWSTPR